jgi:DNA-binding beta-propeller fold protein YncE
MGVLEPLVLMACMGAALNITTAAGTGSPGERGDGGPANRAQLNQPFDVAFDSLGNLFLSDTFNHRIRKVDRRTGIILTVAGTGMKGYSGDGGPAVLARLDEPYGIVLDRHGNLYFADRLNRRIRRVDAASGLISTVAGTGQAAFSGDGGPAGEAGLVEPNGVALDPEGRTLFIADVAGHRIRKVDLERGLISTFAGTGRPEHSGDGGPAAQASIWGARAVEVGADKTVYILERESNRLRAVDPRTGFITTIAGTGAKGYSGDGGPSVEATLSGPKELAVDRHGNVWIVDTENHAIRVIDSRTQLIHTVAGTGFAGSDGDGGPALRARLDRPHGVAVAADGSIWISDTNNHRIRVLRSGPGACLILKRSGWLIESQPRRFPACRPSGANCLMTRTLGS